MNPKDQADHLDMVRALGGAVPDRSPQIAATLAEQPPRARTAYDIYRGGFRTGAAVPPHWDDLPPYVRDAITVAYLQGTLDRSDKRGN